MLSFWFFFILFSLVITIPLSSAASKLRLDEFKRHRAQLVGSKFSLLCTIQEGNGPLRFEWTKDGRILPPTGTNHQVKSTSEDNSVFTINQLSTADAGNYSCSVSNGAGQSDRQTTMLTLEGF